MNQMTKEDKLLLAQVEDKISQCEDQYMGTNTGFLDIHQRTIVDQMIKSQKHNCKVEFFGGYDDAERVICMFLPDYLTVEDAHPLTIIRVNVAEGSKKLNHRDYLGSLLGLGIKREKIGDIIVGENCADIIMDEDIAEFVLLNYSKAGRNYLTLSQHPIDDLKISEAPYKEVTDTLASLRLDNVVSSAFNIARSKAAEAIRRGIVFLNNLECLKPDKEVFVGNKIVLRGKGKAYLVDIGGKSRKDRTYVTFRVYGD